MNMTEYLRPPQTIAVVGLSDKPDRPSYQVASYLLNQGFTIVPINPNLESWLGLTAYPSISAVPADLQLTIVDIFRQPDQVLGIVEEVIAAGRQPLIWMQEGVVSNPAKELAETHGLTVVMDRCLMKEHRAQELA